MLALSIRQPYAEMILRGEKTIEYRSRATKMIGKRFYIYASKGRGQLSVAPHSCQFDGLHDDSLPRGVIVGSATISKCTVVRASCPDTDCTRAGCPCHRYEWHLSKVKRNPKPRKPKRQPQPVWFRPF